MEMEMEPEWRGSLRENRAARSIAPTVTRTFRRRSSAAARRAGADRMSDLGRVRRQLSSVQLALLAQSLSWVVTVIEQIPPIERTGEEWELLRLIRHVRRWMLDDVTVR